MTIANQSTHPLRRLLASVTRPLDVLFPRTTAPIDHAISDRSWQPDAPSVYCRRCGATARAEGVGPRGCAFCVNQALPWERLLRLGAYQEPLRSWILALKFQREWTYARRLGQLLGPLVREQSSAPARTLLCPVPMHFFRRYLRGYNQAQLLAQAVSQSSGLPMLELLTRVRHHPPQTRVRPSARARNVRGTIRAHPIDLAGCDIWLIDDVKTTGSTLSLCARHLRRQGAKEIRVAVAAVADPRHTDFQKL